MEFESQVDEETLFGGFDPQVQHDVEGLLWLGHLEDAFEFCGHHFVIRTLKGDEELNAALVCKEYTESLGQAKAWAWANIALALESVDGDPHFCPAAGPDRKAFARARFQYATQQWYWPVCEYIFTRYATLIERQQEAIKAVQDLSTGSRSAFSPSPASSTDPGASEKDLPPEILELLDEDSTDSSTSSSDT